MSDRVGRLTEALQRSSFDAIAVVPGASMRYLTGLDMHAGMRLTIVFFPKIGQPAFVIPALELPRAQALVCTPMTFYPWRDDEGPQAALRRCLEDLELTGKCIGTEYTAMRLLELRGIEAAITPVQVEDATTLIANLRMVKDVDELASMRRAVRIVEDALHEAIAQIRVGMTERELAEIWEHAIRAAGSSPSFESIIASGSNAANPHHTNSDRAFQHGDLIIMDGGALYDGYASDITRTVVLGEPPAEARRIYDLVFSANVAGRTAVQPGATGEAIDRAARTVIADGGYAAQFLHRTGHGLGLEMHEPPYIVAGSREPLPIGATFTIEPGIYVAGFGGVRIEDDVVVTPDGGESLTTFARELIVI